VAHEATPNGHRIRRLLLGPRRHIRTSDRLQLVAHVALFSLLLASIPIAVTVALRTYSETHRQAVAEAADRLPVNATLVADTAARHPVTGTGAAGAPVVENGGEETVTTSRAMAFWTTASGTKKQGSVVVPLGTAAGSPVRIWLDPAGHVTRAPLTDTDAMTRAIGHALVTVLLVVTGAFGAHRAAIRALRANRARRWDAEWADVEPSWTRQFS
jgi:hypothetical protein